MSSNLISIIFLLYKSKPFVYLHDNRGFPSVESRHQVEDEEIYRRLEDIDQQ